MILALETATNVCSVTFSGNDGSTVEKRTEQRGSHSEQLFLFIEQLKQEHDFSLRDLDALLVSEGPGSYTGLRISASAVKGLLFGCDVPLYGINTLASFAMSAMENSDSQTIHSIIDARRVHVYHQKFNFKDGELTSGDRVEVIPIQAFEGMVRKGDKIIGTGLNRISETVLNKAETLGPAAITSKSLISLFNAGFERFYHQVAPEQFEPKYYTSSQVN